MCRVLRNPLPLKEPPLLSSPAASNGGEMLVDIENLTVDIDLKGVAKGSGRKGFAPERLRVCLGEGLIRGLTRLQDVRGYLLCRRLISTCLRECVV